MVEEDEEEEEDEEDEVVQVLVEEEVECEGLQAMAAAVATFIGGFAETSTSSPAVFR